MPISPLTLPQGVAGLQYGLNPQRQQAPQPQQRQRQREPWIDRAQGAGIADILSNPIQVESGGWGEAIAEALAAGLRGRTVRDERQVELDTETREQKTEDAQRSAVSRALAGFDPQNPQAMVGALAQDAPEQAMSIASALIGDQGSPPERYGPLEQIEGRLGQPNMTTGQYDWAPQVPIGERPPSGYRFTPDGNLGAVQGGPADPTRPGAPQPPLRGADARQMTRVQETAEGSRGLRGLVDEFDSYLAQQDTFPGSGAQIWDTETRAMTALAARMTGLMRPSGSGATSDFEQRLYARGAPSVDNTREANRAIIGGIRTLADIADARQQFFEEFAAQNGTLMGAEQAFQQSPDFMTLTGQEAPAADAGGEIPEGITPEEWRVMTPEERALFTQ